MPVIMLLLMIEFRADGLVGSRESLAYARGYGGQAALPASRQRAPRRMLSRSPAAQLLRQLPNNDGNALDSGVGNRVKSAAA